MVTAFLAACGGGGGSGDDPNPPAGFDVLSAGGGRPRGVGESGHVCRIDAGMLYCWGDNTDYQLGTDAVGSSNVPLQVGTDADWQSVSAGAGYTCGIRSGMLYCWGANVAASGSYGLLGLGVDYDAIDNVAEPTRVGTAADWVSVNAGQSHACGLRAGRLAYCWGRNQDGQLGIGSFDDSNVPVEVVGGIAWDRIVAGMGPYTHGLLDDGTLVSWGELLEDSAPVPPVDGSKYRTITNGGFAVCGIRTDGTLWCMGNNQHGQQGQGDREEKTFTQVGTAEDWEAVEAGVGFVCGIRAGALYCWGRDMAGELGLGEDPSAFTSCVNEGHGSADVHWDCLSPELVDDSRVYTALTVGSRHSCALSGSDVYCWGWNDNGQAGQAASDTPVWVPTLVSTEPPPI